MHEHTHQRRPAGPAEFPAAHAAGRATANDGDAASALRIVASWGDTALAVPFRARPSLSPVLGALDAARSATTRPNLDALSLALAQWCEAASARGNASDLAGLMLGAVNAAAACTCAETPDAPSAGDPFAPRR